MNTHTQFSVEHRDELLSKCRAIAEKARAAGRSDLTADESKQVDGMLDEVRGINAAITADAASKRILSALDEMAAGSFGNGDDTRRLCFGKAMASRFADQVMPAGGQKALGPSGAAVVDQEFDGDPIALGRPANSLLSVLPVKQHATQEFSYLRQSVRSNTAAVVAEGAVKPTSTYSVVRVEDSLKVIAHLSEGVPRFWFLDNASLMQFVSAELQYGLQVAIEAKVLADINAVSGLVLQAYATNTLTVLRKSLTTLQTAGFEPGFFLVNPADWEATELLLVSTAAVDYQGLPYDAASRRLFGVPVVVSPAQAAGVSHTIGAGAVALDTDGRGAVIQWSETSNTDDFSKNLIRARCEGRFATSVYLPGACVKGDLTP